MWLFRHQHKKVYLAIRDYGPAYNTPKTLQVARWQCDECGHQGEDEFTQYYYISFGKLVPDSKRWANWGGKP